MSGSTPPCIMQAALMSMHQMVGLRDNASWHHCILCHNISMIQACKASRALCRSAQSCKGVYEIESIKKCMLCSAGQRRNEVRACVRSFVRGCVRACVLACVRACVRACVCVHTRGALQGAASTVEGLHESCVSASIAEDDFLVAFPFTWKGNMT